MHKHIRVSDIDERIERYRSFTQSYSDEEPVDADVRRVGRAGGFSLSALRLKHALDLFWLQGLKDGGSLAAARAGLLPVIRRAIWWQERYADVQFIRADHESLLLQLATLAGGPSEREAAARNAWDYEHYQNRDQYIAGWNGLMKARILRQPGREQACLAHSLGAMPSPLFICPTPKMLRSFAGVDCKAMAGEVRAALAKRWKFIDRVAKAPDQQSRVTVSFEKMNLSEFWPRSEATLVKLSPACWEKLPFDAAFLPQWIVAQSP
jgi:hypothetical protein